MTEEGIAKLFAKRDTPLESKITWERDDITGPAQGGQVDSYFTYQDFRPIPSEYALDELVIPMKAAIEAFADLSKELERTILRAFSAHTLTLAPGNFYTQDGGRAGFGRLVKPLGFGWRAEWFNPRTGTISMTILYTMTPARAYEPTEDELAAWMLADLSR
jgi:hypothetical protein